MTSHRCLNQQLGEIGKVVTGQQPLNVASDQLDLGFITVRTGPKPSRTPGGYHFATSEAHQILVEYAEDDEDGRPPLHNLATRYSHPRHKKYTISLSCDGVGGMNVSPSLHLTWHTHQPYDSGENRQLLQVLLGTAKQAARRNMTRRDSLDSSSLSRKKNFTTVLGEGVPVSSSSLSGRSNDCAGWPSHPF